MDTKDSLEDEKEDYLIFLYVCALLDHDKKMFVGASVDEQNAAMNEVKRIKEEARRRGIGNQIHSLAIQLFKRIEEKQGQMHN